jgi:3-dehydrosphinganine reductase
VTSIAGSHAVVTGGSSGIGLATARLLAGRGARVSVIALDDADLDALASDPPPGALLTAADVGDRRQAETAVAASVAARGPCDILVTSAGVAMPGYFQELGAEEFERHMRVNYFGTLWCIRAVIPSMTERRSGSIVAISSTAGLLGVFGYAAYGPSKYAVRGLCDVLRTEMRPHGVSVTCVFPSDVDTPQFHNENLYKPFETHAISGTVQPISAERVARAIVRGIDKGAPVVYPDPKTRVVARIAGTAPGTTRSYLAAVVRRAQRRHRPGD